MKTLLFMLIFSALTSGQSIVHTGTLTDVDTADVNFYGLYEYVSVVLIDTGAIQTDTVNFFVADKDSTYWTQVGVIKQSDKVFYDFATTANGTVKYLIYEPSIYHLRIEKADTSASGGSVITYLSEGKRRNK